MGVGRAQFLFGHPDQILHGSDVTQHRPGLDLPHRSTAQHSLRLYQLHLGEHSRPHKKRVGGDANPRGDASAHIGALTVDRIHGGGCPKVQHHQRRTVFLQRCNTGHGTVGAQTLIPAHAIGKAGVHILIHDDGRFSKILHHGIGERMHYLGHHRGNDDILHILGFEPESLKILPGGQPDLIGSPVGVGHETEAPGEGLPLKHAEHHICVPHINRKQHFKSHLLSEQSLQPLSFRCYSDSIAHYLSIFQRNYAIRGTAAPTAPRIQHPQAVHLFAVGDMRVPKKEDIRLRLRAA